ncbi:MAG TPA: hypothetical protein VGO00_12435 [Kofleriaceae bacterium]|nr:hypothetical protein [Kofleriaceae bacterium]
MIPSTFSFFAIFWKFFSLTAPASRNSAVLFHFAVGTMMFFFLMISTMSSWN